MKAKFILFLLICLQWIQTSGQDLPIAIETVGSEINSVINSKYSQYNITELEYKKKLLGSNFLYDDWEYADLELRLDSTVLKNILVKMDITNNLIEIKLENTSKLIPSMMVKEIKFKNTGDKAFTSRNEIGLFGPVGFYKILIHDKIELYCYYTTKLIEAHYNAALDSGTKDNELKIDTKYFFKYNDKLIELESQKNKLAEQLGNDPAIKTFIDENKLKFKSEEDLIKLFDFLNNNLTLLNIK